MAKNKTVGIKQIKKRILNLKSSMIKNLSTVTGAVSRMITNVNSVLNTLADEEYLRNIGIGIEQPKDFDVYDSTSHNAVFSAYKNIPQDFFDMGENYAKNFSDGFISGISGLDGGGSYGISTNGGASTENITYNSNYNFYSSGLTVTQQLEQARREEQLKQLRA